MTQFPEGWNEERVQRLLARYDDREFTSRLMEATWYRTDGEMVFVPRPLAPAARAIVQEYIRTHSDELLSEAEVLACVPDSADEFGEVIDDDQDGDDDEAEDGVWLFVPARLVPAVTALVAHFRSLLPAEPLARAS